MFKKMLPLILLAMTLNCNAANKPSIDTAGIPTTNPISALQKECCVTPTPKTWD